MTDATDLEGTLVGPLADADGNKLLVLDIYRPKERYINYLYRGGKRDADAAARMKTLAASPELLSPA